MNGSGSHNYIRQKPMFDHPSVHLFPFEQHWNRGARPNAGTEKWNRRTRMQISRPSWRRDGLSLW
ncbi:hypothetical protein RHMOL_Rhmol13G0113400 [Rhododendron molle]|uniref:Uncharacterized protein n=1 Tax=Rhododendron molle TaxID=49168 RepID=A0ACC0L6K2_RHOML|nr:hypothetical protein RHMOL_Rhmol13G0113400 [Rhododendron molle]